MCHDLGHLPFSHVAEKQLLGKQGHEKWTARMIASDYLAPIWEVFQQQTMQRDVASDVIKIALGTKKFSELFPNKTPLTSWESVVSEMLTGDFFGADRIDYLLRDSQCSGLAYGSFDYHQLFETLQILPSNEKQGELALGIEQNGIESCEALLLSRHYMYKRLYQHPTVKAYSFHLARFMEKIDYDLSENLDQYINMTDNEIMAEVNRASRDVAHPGHFDASCLYLRHFRFYAVPMRAHLRDEDLRLIREELGLTPDQMVWELTRASQMKKQTLSFPVLTSNGQVLSSDKLSEVAIPLLVTDWVFIASEHVKSFRSYLAHHGLTKV